VRHRQRSDGFTSIKILTSELAHSSQSAALVELCLTLLKCFISAYDMDGVLLAISLLIVTKDHVNIIIMIRTP